MANSYFDIEHSQLSPPLPAHFAPELLEKTMYTIEGGNDTKVNVREHPAGGPVVVLSIKEKDGHEVEANLGIEDVEVLAAALIAKAKAVAGK